MAISLVKPKAWIGPPHPRKDPLSPTIDTYLYGRKGYEMMMVWETPDVIPSLSPVMMDFERIWQAASKINYSKSLETVTTPKTRLKREFEPPAVRDLKAQLPHDITVAGPNLATQAIRAGLVEEFQLLIVPALLGGGTQVLLSSVGVQMDLLDECSFDNDRSIFVIARGPVEDSGQRVDPRGDPASQ